MKQGRGTKRSSWITFKRRLLLVRLLLRKPTSKQELITTVQTMLHDEGYPVDADSALKNDLEALKRDFDCNIKFQRVSACYQLLSVGQLALLDLSDDSLEGLNFLEANFPEGDALPEYTNIRTLIDEIRRLLPPDRQMKLHQRTTMNVERTVLASERVSAEIIKKLRKALWQHEIEFHYVSNQPGNARVCHRAAPYAIIFSLNGHVYLDASILAVEPNESQLHLPKATMYRIDRIIPETLKLLSRRIPAQRIGVQTYTIKYWLHPNVARRRDIATYFPHSTITYHEDESATIVATTTNLWQARQMLLRYGSACIALEPQALVDLFRKTVEEMASNYGLQLSP